ncbi:MAG: site-specific integrase [Acidobacteria bacterium]|nr:site-specific integrase [Acidobacteriota bacterium]
MPLDYDEHWPQIKALVSEQLRLLDEDFPDNAHLQLIQRRHDDDERPIPVVSGFLRHLSARGYSPNTLSAYAYDLLHFFRFLSGAAIVIWNTVHLQACAKKLRSDGEQINDDDLRYLSPLLRQHIGARWVKVTASDLVSSLRERFFRWL